MARALEGKVAVVTGSGQGVGRGIAMVLAREGAKLITNNRKPYTGGDIAADRGLSEEERRKALSLRGDAAGVAEEIKALGGEAVPFYGDVADFATAGRMIQLAMDTFGRIDIVVNNAAGLGSGTVLETSEQDWDYQTVPKLKGAFNCMKHALPHMVKQRFGRVINVSSDAWVGIAGLAAYGAANAGIVGLTWASAKDLYKAGVTVNAICPHADSPGHVVESAILIRKVTNLGIKIDEQRLKAIEDNHGPAENMAPFVAYLATEAAGYISGSVFTAMASGRITLYSDPAPVQTIKKDNSPWTMEELIESVPEKLMKGYVSRASISDFG